MTTTVDHVAVRMAEVPLGAARGGSGATRLQLPHFLPELHVHLAAAARTATWIEHFPLIDDLLDTTPRPEAGRVQVPQAPGHGMAWNTEALDRFTTARLDSSEVHA